MVTLSRLWPRSTTLPNIFTLLHWRTPLKPDISTVARTSQTLSGLAPTSRNLLKLIIPIVLQMNHFSITVLTLPRWSLMKYIGLKTISWIFRKRTTLFFHFWKTHPYAFPWWCVLPSSKCFFNWPADVLHRFNAHLWSIHQLLDN